MALESLEAPRLVPGFRLDRCELLCPIAQGGMASVWVARLRSKHGFEKLVAIKTILPQFASDVRFQEMFLDEARIASGVDHANVAQVVDLGEEHGVLYLVMEWVDGNSLSKLLSAIRKHGRTFPAPIALQIMAEACAGLHAAHELKDKNGLILNVVHRDVSPQNLLLSTGGVVKVIDFGIAKARDRAADETITGSIKGKLHFMAPEQAMGKLVDRRADVWAAGAVLYLLLTGHPPHEGDNHLATLHSITTGQRPPPLPSTVPAAVSAVVERALAYDPEARFPTAAAMQQAIEVAMAAAGWTASASDIAALGATYLGAQNAQRRRAIDLALRAAADRDRLLEGIDDDRIRSAILRNPNATGRFPRLDRLDDSLMPPPPSSDEPQRETHPPTTEHSNATLHAVVSALHPQAVRRLTATAGAAALILLLVVALVRRAPQPDDTRRGPAVTMPASPRSSSTAPPVEEPAPARSAAPQGLTVTPSMLPISVPPSPAASAPTPPRIPSDPRKIGGRRAPPSAPKTPPSQVPSPSVNAPPTPAPRPAVPPPSHPSIDDGF